MRHKHSCRGIFAGIASVLWIMFQNTRCDAFLSHHHPVTYSISEDCEQRMGEESSAALPQGRRQQAQPQGRHLYRFQLNGLFGAGNKVDPTTEEDTAAPKRIFSIECDSIKQGALRFTLGLYLIGQQNNPTKSSWTANQADDGGLKMYYMDKTAMFSVTLSDNSVVVDRHGPSPSLRYMLQESVLLHGFLDELESLAMGGSDDDGGDDIKDENRLLILTEPNMDFENARGTLPARAANT